MPINDPEAIRFVNEQIRPLAEKFRDLKAEVDASTVQWFGGIDAKFTADPTLAVEDGRDSEGVSRLIGSDVVNMMTQMLAYQTQLDAGGIGAVISKPTVRPLRVRG